MKRTIESFAEGITAVVGSGTKYTATLSGNWVEGDQVLFTAVDSQTALVTQVGAGYASGLQPTFAFAYRGKAYFLADNTVLYSAIGAPATLNDINAAGNSFVNLSNYFSTPERVLAMAVFQGRLVFFSRGTTQIFTVDADPSAWQQLQVFDGLGTVAAESVKQLGDLDVLFLSDTGFRSLRVRDSSLNAFVDDIGSPIDQMVKDVLAAHDGSTAIGIWENSTGRYWCFLYDRFYVFSYFRSGKIQAWSTYLPTYSSGGVQTAFTPNAATKMNGRLFFRDAGAVYLYGGADGETYDDCVASGETPWLDDATPTTVKESESIDAAYTGAWKIAASMDTESELVETVVSEATHTFNKQGHIPFVAQGTHLKVRFETTGATKAVFSSLVWNYKRLGFK